MDENKKREARKAGITERGIMLMEECKRFMKESNSFLNEEIENEDQAKRAEEILEKIEWYKRELEIERKKSAEPFEMLNKFIIGEKKIAM